jgi:hypothetical protein
VKGEVLETFEGARGKDGRRWVCILHHWEIVESKSLDPPQSWLDRCPRASSGPTGLRTPPSPRNP